MEIHRDFELNQQQQALSKHTTCSVIQCPSHSGQDQCTEKSQKVIETTNSLFDGVMQLQTVPNERETVLNVSTSKTTENVLCQISPVNPPLAIEKRQFIIVSDNSMLFNIAPKENKTDQKEINNDIVRHSEIVSKPEMTDLSLILDNYSERKISKTPTAESDSENEEDDIEPVYDYEPDPDTVTKINVEQVEKPNKCYMCFRSFRQKKNMYAHIRKIHSTQPKIEGGILCPLCKMHALRQEHLRNHLETLHEIPIEKEEKLFNTIEGTILYRNLSFFLYFW